MIFGRRRARLLALLGARNEERYLPGLLENLAGQVDGIVAIDDGSTDRTGEILAASPLVLEILPPQSPRPRLEWQDDGVAHRRLIEAAWRHGADWLLGIDADERVERRFRARAERVFATARRDGTCAYRVHFRELWDRPDRWRCDGVFGTKVKACLFRSLPGEHEFDMHPLHANWAPMNHRVDGGFPTADLNLYHLRMLHEADRRERQARYERLDPDRRHQAIGYDYMTRTEGLELAGVPRGRGFVPPPA